MGAGDGLAKMDMETDAVAEAAGRLATTSGNLSDAWVPTAAAIVGFEPSIGTGRLGAAFGPVYRPLSSQLRAAADAVPPKITAMANATSFGSDTYGVTDQDIALGFQALVGTPSINPMLGPVHNGNALLPPDVREDG